MKSAGLFLGILLAASAASAGSFDFSEYSRLLSRTVKPGGMVNYWGLQAGQSALDEVIEAMQKISLDEFAAWPEAERLAFLINAYNARVLQIISRQRHVLFRTNGWFQKGLSVRRYDGFFDEIPVRLLGRDRTLDSLEEELRRYYDEPGVHMALVKGAKGSPPLRPEAYTAEKLPEQLRDQTENFLRDLRNFQVSVGKKRIRLSPVFKELCGDCISRYSDIITAGDFSPADRAMLGFIASHVNGATREFLLTGDYSISWLKFDWMLNEEDPPARAK
ncbi:MAG TPA: DUF547 domain-containing protein [Kiritimatiellia bacterium]|nr:DUF547 domain-containing protein [Kiritimatiellia bacterium]HNS81901.1 DUF547 domain-containing protein [Kiritimatiellia bacterium]HPA78332.1 DUF547 domain-containing protein [Kiritimatiellia bacterium]HQQ04438.1 DUF547 domain-containing protein [Kiritimatiellia bacterium]